MREKNPSRHAGFTLIELAIVVVIIGILVAGIVVGTEMRRNARLRGVITDLDRYTKAVGLFQEKYFALPGDMATATALWGTGVSCPGGNNITISTNTCNGDGDNRVGFSNSSAAYLNSGTADSKAAGGEMVAFWHHLSLAGFIEPNYGFCANCLRAPGSSAGKTTFTDLSFSFGWMERPMGGVACTYYQGLCNGGNWFYVANKDRRNVAPFSDRTSAIVDFQAVEALNIDTKIDDGLPATGNMMAAGTWVASHPGTNCTTSATVASALYDIATLGTSCQMFFKTEF